MPDFQTRTRAASPSSTGVGPASSGGESAQDQLGNQAMQDQLGLSGDAPGRLSYRDALGDLVGDALYDQLEDQLTDDKLVEHAEGAVDAALDTLQSYFRDNAAPSDQEAAELFVAALRLQIDGLAQQAVVDSGFSQGVRDVVDDNPYLIASAAVAGAVAYVLSNQDLPLLEHKVGLGGGHALLAGVDVGRTMDLALEQVRVGYRYVGGADRASVTADGFQDGGWQVQGAFERTLDPGEQVRLQGLHVDRPGEERSRMDLSYSNPSMAASAYWERMHGEQTVDAFGGALSTMNTRPGDLNGYLRGEYRTDGSWESAGGLSREQDDLRWSVEGFAGQDAFGRQDHGVRAMLNWRF